MFFNAVGLLDVYDEMSVMQVVKLTCMADICSSLKQIKASTSHFQLNNLKLHYI